MATGDMIKKAKPASSKKMATKSASRTPVVVAPEKPDRVNSDVSRDLRLLRAILEPQTTTKKPTPPARRPRTQSKAPTKPTNSLKASSHNEADETEKVQQEAEETKKLIASPYDQKKLAMNSFNQNLKVLSAFVKKKHERKQQSQVSSQAAVDIKTTSETQRVEAETVREHAECASAALDVLRIHDPNDETTEDTRSKREQGAVMLLDKLISLDLKESAHQLATKIYEQYWKRRKSDEPLTTGRKLAVLSVSALLRLPYQPDSRTELALACSFQSQTLRLAILQGFEALDDDFIEAVSLEAITSPAQLIISANRRGIFDSSKTVESIRTIAQALAKFYAVVVKSSPQSASTAGVALALFVEAKLHSIEARSMLDQKIDLTEDLWHPITRAVKQLWCNKTQKDEQRYHLTNTCLQRLQTYLAAHGLPNATPPSLSSFLVQLAEDNNDTETAIRLLTDELTRASGLDKVAMRCQLATIQITNSDTSSTHKSLQELLQEFDAAFAEDLMLQSEQLLWLVRFRKACSQQLACPPETVEFPAPADFEISLLKMLVAILRFCNTQHKRACAQKHQVAKSLGLAVLKTIEAIVDFEPHAFKVGQSLLDQYLSYIEQCTFILSTSYHGHVTEGDALADVVSALIVKVSNVFWRAHMSPIIIEQSLDRTLEMAQKSLSSLEGLSLDQLTKAALGPRLEKAACLQRKAGHVENALESLQRAIQHYVAIGALVDAVETSLSKRTGAVWSDSSSLAHQLGRAINAHQSLSVDTNGFESSIYDIESLPEIHRAVMLELQLFELMRKHFTPACQNLALRTAQKILELAAQPEYYVWRLRFAWLFSYRVSRSPVFSSENVSGLVTILSDVIIAPRSVDSVFLQHCRPALEPLLKLNHGLLTNNMDGLSDELLEAIVNTARDCSDRLALERTFDDLASLHGILEALSKRFFAAGQYQQCAFCLQTQLHLTSFENTEVLVDASSYALQLAVCYVRLDALDRAKEVMQNLASATTHLNAVLHHLTLSEYHLAKNDLHACREHLRQAGVSATAAWPSNTELSKQECIQRDSVVARGVLIASYLSERLGHTSLANRYARQAVKIASSIWATFAKWRRLETTTVRDESSMLTLSEGVSKLHLNPTQAPFSPSVIASNLWPHIDLYVRSLENASSLLSHAGLLDDALNFLKQLECVADVGLQVTASVASGPMLSALYVKANRSKEALELLNGIHDALKACKGPRTAEAYLSCAEAYQTLGLADDTLAMARAALNGWDFSTEKTPKSLPPQEVLQVGLTKPRRNGTKSTTIGSVPPKRQKATTKATVGNHVVAQAGTSLLPKASYRELSLRDRHAAVVRLTDPASSGETGDDGWNTDDIHFVHNTFALAKASLSQAWEKLCADSLRSVVTESALALPSKSFRLRGGRVSFLQGGADKISFTPSRQVKERCLETVNSSDEISHLLQQALKYGRILLQERRQYCPTEMLHTIARIETRASLLLTTMDAPFAESPIDLVLRAGQPQDEALNREMMIAKAEQATKERSKLSIWPDVTDCGTLLTTQVTVGDLQTLPLSWTIVSLTLSEDKDELLVSKIVRGRSPFLVRIPLRRSNEGEGVDDFMFEDAAQDMRDIIEKANNTSHDPRAMSDKSARAEWHADRENLNERLMVLLQNIESIWLGGFRALLVPHHVGAQGVKRFRKTLMASIDKHLPSRQRLAKNTPLVEIHDHILELFLGLGDPEELELDDAIIDLLYFVVDVLQFEGERNAYDEVDWDAMLVDVLDGLRAYHEPQPSQMPSHTILILDKELEMFPLESLPCLIDHPVSRMPSLASVFTRLAEARSQDSEASGLQIRTADCRGAYILNPGIDLASTERLLQPILSTSSNPTSTFVPLVAKAPTEEQFSTLLAESDIVLYFGHGSGGQYIRPRTIRALPRCATTLLFGCSSAKMTTHGAFESTGMPRAYMLAGAPAVVGCLWDVTDREIDRVALQSLSRWGLIDVQDERVQDGLKIKGRKGKAKTERTAQDCKRDRKTLVQAVQEGRQACVLRYLCGAAVVVYGIPVMLT